MSELVLAVVSAVILIGAGLYAVFQLSRSCDSRRQSWFAPNFALSVGNHEPQGGSIRGVWVKWLREQRPDIEWT